MRPIAWGSSTYAKGLMAFLEDHPAEAQELARSAPGPRDAETALHAGLAVLRLRQGRMRETDVARVIAAADAALLLQPEGWRSLQHKAETARIEPSSPRLHRGYGFPGGFCAPLDLCSGRFLVRLLAGSW